MKKATPFLLVTLVLFSACKKEETRQIDSSYNPILAPGDFVNSTQLTNSYFQFEPGKKYVYEGQTDEGAERTEVERLDIAKTVMGITCVVVRDRVWLAGKLHEDTDDWFAQDKAGNVWYMGEDVDNLNPDGSLKDHAGSWEAGVDGAKPGINMLAKPAEGNAYRQEYYFNEAEDQAEVLETGLTLTVPYGTFQNCIKTKEWTELEPDAFEYKFYAPGIGFIKSVSADGEETVLVGIQ